MPTGVDAFVTHTYAGTAVIAAAAGLTVVDQLTTGGYAALAPTSDASAGVLVTFITPASLDASSSVTASGGATYAVTAMGSADSGGEASSGATLWSGAALDGESDLACEGERNSQGIVDTASASDMGLSVLLTLRGRLSIQAISHQITSADPIRFSSADASSPSACAPVAGLVTRQGFSDSESVSLVDCGTIGEFVATAGLFGDSLCAADGFVTKEGTASLGASTDMTILDRLYWEPESLNDSGDWTPAQYEVMA
ncbi:hypothetical protein [Bordetella flabilis]|nr:hypothetical protein [Bordetella flabilis]